MWFIIPSGECILHHISIDFLFHGACVFLMRQNWQWLLIILLIIPLIHSLKSYSYTYILSRASEAGSPTNRPGSDKTQGHGSLGPSTGGPDLQGSLPRHKNFKRNEPHIWFAFFTKGYSIWNPHGGWRTVKFHGPPPHILFFFPNAAPPTHFYF